MTSMFDQYNKTLKRDESSVKSSAVTPTSSGYISVRMSQEAPIFGKLKMNISMPHVINHLVVSNGWLMLVMANNVVFRMQLVDINRSDEVALEKYTAGQEISRVFLDPLGAHLLIALVPKSTQFVPELLYLHRSQSKPKRIDKFRDHEITCVAFNYENDSETSTGAILLGTSRGLIFEVELAVESDKVVHNNWKQVFDIGRNENIPITGIEYFRVPNTSEYIVLATSVDRFYKFQETIKSDDRQPLQSIFNSYLNVPEDIQDFHEIKSVAKGKTTKLRVCYDYKSHFPRSFGWITEPCIFYGEMDAKSDSPARMVHNKRIPFPENEKNAPVAFALTDFHAILVYPDHLTAISLLNYQVVYEEFISENLGPLQNAVRDYRENVIYVYSTKVIFRIRVTNEERNVWQIYLEKGEFDRALRYAKDNPAHLDIVLCKQAEQCFNRKEFIESARLFAETKSSFEGICLKFLEINENEALMIFLRKRLEGLKAQDKSQITMLVVWMVELFLTEMARRGDSQEQVRVLQRDFDVFMNTPRVVECMKTNRSVIYDLMASHGDAHNLATFTAVNRDFENVVNQHIALGKFLEALNVLRGQNRPELFYKYAPILMENIPAETIAAAMAQGKRLDPVKLLPTLIVLESDVHVTEIIRYLEYCVHLLGCSETAIHNFLIKLYAQNRSEKLMIFLETQGKDVSMIHYDVHYALRVCRQHNVAEACVFLQCLLEMWHQAVELALTVNTKLAQHTASMAPDRDLRRKLWLRIAEHEIRGREDVKEALELLQECDLLRIEDLLPFFSDFERIDHFKEAICDALKEYNLKIQEQRRDMDESAKSAEKVRAELQSFRNRSVTISASDQCTICSAALLVRPFFVFPCGHKFHEDCLEKHLAPLLGAEAAQRLSGLKLRLSMLGAGEGDAQNAREALKEEIQSIVAADCCFCGELTIETIDKPFISDWERVRNDWE
ncbi:vacuolar protein sorting-associated protein 18 homolog isoform X2 [Phlebotomus argentipes]|uniref:vacuolar protein sorting-associated protein 18 homolog isoform X2 n=1 Tax=Phlebotomus argentipes TaxID=94469 RepID=UPI00289303BB|nr:vacuolar protein sorting-associated protein 18 homolog isoform X2 [Phlebotomus argentipes]